MTQARLSGAIISKDHRQWSQAHASGITPGFKVLNLEFGDHSKLLISDLQLIKALGLPISIAYQNRYQRHGVVVKDIDKLDRDGLAACFFIFVPRHGESQFGIRTDAESSPFVLKDFDAGPAIL